MRTPLRNLAAYARLLSAGLLVACAAPPPAPPPPADPGCVAIGAALPLCGFQNPEDLAILPDGVSVVVSEYGSMEGNKAGALSLLDLSNNSRRELYRGGQPVTPVEGWGAESCPGAPPAAFSPHGIHLSRRADERLQLLVVQHGGRESVEFFEVLDYGGEDSGRWQLAWRGCAVAGKDVWLNDVVAIPEGGFLATHMLPRSQADSVLAGGPIRTGPRVRPTGEVLEWQPVQGYRSLPGTRAAMPNGIELSPDGRTLYLNATLNSAVFVIDRASGARRATIEVATPDNSTWTSDGRLLVASLVGLADMEECSKPGQRFCPVRFEIVEIDTDTLFTRVLYSNSGPPMGAGTVGLRVGDELLVGSFVGDRVLRVDLKTE